MQRRYAGTRLGRQELDGVLMADIDGALWTRAMLDAAHATDAPDMDRIVVAVDPPVTGTAQSDDCGIVVVGVVMDGPPQDWKAFVLEDASVGGMSPQGWAEAGLFGGRVAGGRIVWWLRSIRAAIWLRPCCGRSTL